MYLVYYRRCMNHEVFMSIRKYKNKYPGAGNSRTFEEVAWLLVGVIRLYIWENTR